MSTRLEIGTGTGTKEAAVAASLTSLEIESETGTDAASWTTLPSNRPETGIKSAVVAALSQRISREAEGQRFSA